MMRRRRRLIPALAIALGAVLGGGAAGAGSTCGADGLQASGSIYRICMPDAANYNGRVVLWAHGFQDAGTPVQIPEDQLQIGDVSLPAIVNGLGYGFATNSYRKTGLAVRPGMEDLVDLVEIYAQAQGTPTKVFLTGASEGGLITTLLIEQRSDLFAGGVAACGPIGDFPLELRYFGDARAAFEYFFPGLIPGDPFHPTQDLADGWAKIYAQSVEPIIFAPASRDQLDQFVRVARLPFDPARYLESLAVSVRDVLRYAVVNLNDAAATLGGFPYDNASRWYTGSDDDIRLNRLIPRVSADPAALEEMRTHYDTTGVLTRPLVTLHTRWDQQVPYAQAALYNLKTIVSRSFLRKHVHVAVDRFEHCNFTTAEALVAFFLMLRYAGDIGGIDGIGSVLAGPPLAEFESLAQRHGLPYGIAGPLRVRPPRR